MSFIYFDEKIINTNNICFIEKKEISNEKENKYFLIINLGKTWISHPCKDKEECQKLFDYIWKKLNL